MGNSVGSGSALAKGRNRQKGSNTEYDYDNVKTFWEKGEDYKTFSGETSEQYENQKFADVNEFFKDNSNLLTWVNDMSDDEKHSINRYVDTSYVSMNRLLFSNGESSLSNGTINNIENLRDACIAPVMTTSAGAPPSR